MHAFIEKYRAEYHHFLLFSFFSFEGSRVCLHPHCDRVVEVAEYRDGFTGVVAGGAATRPPTAWGVTIIGQLPDLPPFPFADIIQGRVWVAVTDDRHPRCPNHRRGQSPSSKTGTPSEVIIDKG